MKFKTTSANRGCCAMTSGGCKGCGSKQLSSYDWLNDIPESLRSSDMVEVQFKNTRKGYYLNSEGLELSKGDIVAVGASPGHDIGEVTLTGKLVELAIKKHRWRPDKGEILSVYRLARPSDLERWEDAKRREEPTMIQARQIAQDLGLEMKIGDVEYQGDGNKAIFYYIADGRVDFRQLIRVLADTFHVRIEMKQIGARQEAGRIGGIGPCGRELCCSSWMTTFNTVNTSAARMQDLALNPQKLTGLCGKLRCCMNYEVNAYAEAHKSLPSREVVLETKGASYYHLKTDVFAKQITYSTSPRFPEGLVTIPARRAFDIIGMNQAGDRPDTLAGEQDQRARPRSIDILEDNSLTRFDKKDRGAGKRPSRPAGERRRGARSEASADGMQVRRGGEGQARERQRPPRSGAGRPNKSRPTGGDASTPPRK